MMSSNTSCINHDAAEGAVQKVCASTVYLLHSSKHHKQKTVDSNTQNIHIHKVTKMETKLLIYGSATRMHFLVV